MTFSRWRHQLFQSVAAVRCLQGAGAAPSGESTAVLSEITTGYGCSKHTVCSLHADLSGSVLDSQMASGLVLSTTSPLGRTMAALGARGISTALLVTAASLGQRS